MSKSTTTPATASRTTRGTSETPESSRNTSGTSGGGGSGGASGGNLPVHTVRHRNIKATVWRNQTEKGPMYNVTVARSYKKEGDEWHDSHSFGYDDLMNLAKVLYDTHSFISALRAKEFAQGKSPRAERAAT